MFLRKKNKKHKKHKKHAKHKSNHSEHVCKHNLRLWHTPTEGMLLLHGRNAAALAPVDGWRRCCPRQLGGREGGHPLRV